MAEVRISFKNCHYTLWWQYKIQENNMLRYISHLQNINICAFLQIGNTSGRFLLNRQSQEIRSQELPRIYFYYQLSYPCPLVIGVDGQPLAAFKFFLQGMLCFQFESSGIVIVIRYCGLSSKSLHPKLILTKIPSQWYNVHTFWHWNYPN